MSTYPFVRLEEERRRLEADGVPVIDFGKGDPNEPTDPRIRQALVGHLTERSSYPLAQGLPELRAAVARWCERRFGVALDPDREIVPTLGSKEAIFSLAQVLVDPRSDKRLVLFTEPGYPVYERGALFGGGEPLALPLRAEHDFLPDLDTVADGLPLRVRRGRAGRRVGVEGVPADRRHGAAGVRAACVGRRVGRRGARGACAGDVPAQARAPPARLGGARPARRGEPGRHVPLGRDARGARAASPRAGHRRLAGPLLRPVGRGLRPLRPRPDRGGVPAGRSGPRGGAGA